MDMTEQERLWLQEMYHLQLTHLYRTMNRYAGTPTGDASAKQIDKIDNRLKELGMESYQCKYAQHQPFFRR